MSDLISRQAAIDALGDIHPLDYNAQAYKARLEKLPSAQPERCEDCGNFNNARLLIPQPERKKGKWIYLNGLDAFECSKELEDAGLIYQKNNPKGHLLVLKTNVFTTGAEREKLRLELQAAAEQPVLLLPACVDVADRRERWIDKQDAGYSGGGYSECSNCGMRYSWGGYFEANEFRYCPRCGHRMEVEEDE